MTKGSAVPEVTRRAVNNLVNKKGRITPEMAIRLAKAFGSRVEVWLGMQMAYDLARARLHEDKITVQCVAPPSA